ncbi:hypothetical protein AY606_12970 [Acinetobacter sp. SFB]|uniref:hypothetical protein n=1 Tax=Acinetobacter sp. SFB TaxID=1805634 RepID=UPI0007D80664|nr:hypothetical protein [Acinetobacter sp. SFB]OAL76227.1 hypothetical protein AY606_12970 [Acinetobacter sp. SFB]
MDITTEDPLFQCHYLPRYLIGLIFIPALFIVLVQHSLNSFNMIQDFSSLIQYLLHQPQSGWLLVILIILLACIAMNLKLVVTRQTISIQNMGIKLNIVVQRSTLFKAQLYSSHASKYRVLKPFTTKVLDPKRWKKCSIGFILKPEFRKKYKMAHLDLNMLNKDNRQQLIQILVQHYSLNPNVFLDREQFSKRKLQHKF